MFCKLTAAIHCTRAAFQWNLKRRPFFAPLQSAGHRIGILNIEEKLIHKAREMTGIHEKTHLVRLGLEALIARESSKRLAGLGGTEKKLRPVPRRRGPVVKNGSR